MLAIGIQDCYRGRYIPSFSVFLSQAMRGMPFLAGEDVVFINDCVRALSGLTMKLSYREQYGKTEEERKGGRERETDRQTDRQTETDRDRQRRRETERHRQRETQTERER